MIIKPRIKGTICTNAHPVGCQRMIEQQVEYARQRTFSGPRFALIIGCSSGYGLASRIALTFGSNTDSLGVCFERPPTERKTASAGWYNNQYLEKLAGESGRYSESLNSDAFLAETKQQVIEQVRALGRKIDLLVYSVAAPRRYDETEGVTYQSVLKPVGAAFEGLSLDTDKQQIKTVQIDAATQAEIDATVKVMGGEDWAVWMSDLHAADLLAEGVQTVAYTYVGDEMTWPIYGDATIGKAKQHLDQTAVVLRQELSPLKGNASVVVLKALVTQSSAAIPVMPLYISLLYRQMKEAGTHENCIEQIQRFMATGLYGQGCMVDEQGRWRLDEFELAPEIQAAIKAKWRTISNENLLNESDFMGFKEDFLNLFGFSVAGIDYDKDISLDPSAG